MSDLSSMAEWLQNHQEWLALVIALSALLESLVIIGLLLPGVVMLFTAATLAGGGALDVWTMLFAGFIGAVVGDGLSFIMGQVFHHRIRGWWPFRTHPQWLAQGERFFDRHGGISIALGRFVGPIRPIIPVVAGMMGMPARYFYLVNILSALVWAPAYLLPGYFVGASLHWQQHMPIELLSIITGLFLIAVVLAYGCQWLLRRTDSYRKLLARAEITFFISLLVLSVFVLLPWNHTVNLQVFLWIQTLKTPMMNQFFSCLSRVADFAVMFSLVILAGFWLYRDESTKGKHPYRNVGIFLALAAILDVSIDLMKLGFGLPRPEQALEQSFAYPSGHTAYTVFIGLWLSWYFSRYLTVRYKPWVWSLGITVALLTGLSRLYLEEHWFMDVLGGLALGSCGFIAWLIIERRDPIAVQSEMIWWRIAQFCTFSLFIFFGLNYFG